MIYKCPNCGGALKYDPISKKMICEYCISYFEPEEISQKTENSKAVQEETATSSEAAQLNADDDYMECNIYSCTSCGGELMVNGLETSTFCAYCGQPTIVFNRVSKELKPKYIIPFSVTKESAIKMIREKLNSGFFVPDEIKNFETERIKGIYIPYWLCDMDYSDKQSLKGTVGSGKNAQTRYFYRAARTSFKNMTLDASERLSDETSQRLEPFNMHELVDFNTSYMSGYYADRYDVDQEKIKQVAIVRGKNLFDMEVKRTVKASNIQILDCKPKIDIKEFKYVLLPAWFLTFRYENEAYTFLVNGQTGKVVGGVPFYKQNVILLISMISAILTFVCAPIIKSLLLMDTDDVGDLIAIIIVVGATALTSALKHFKRIKQSVELSKSKVMMNFVKERQEGD
ncbi:MAG: hypothetical protein ACI4F4_03630 [Lachnospiraceae bacterium]